jgi:predicted kinase
MLIIFSGLSGTGKTTIARELARELAAVYIRIDSIEQAMRGVEMVPTAGYEVAYAVAADNLKLGRTVVADSVNPLAVTRDAWREVATRDGGRVVEVEVVCSDAGEHQRRVESRTTDVPGLLLPNWADVMARDYHPWDRERLVIDTAHRTVAESVTAVHAAIASRAGEI